MYLLLGMYSPNMRPSNELDLCTSVGGSVHRVPFAWQKVSCGRESQESIMNESHKIDFQIILLVVVRLVLVLQPLRKLGNWQWSQWQLLRVLMLVLLMQAS